MESLRKNKMECSNCGTCCSNILLVSEKEKKAIHLGDVSNLSTKMAYVKKILNDEKGVEGEILVNTDLTNKGAVFREKV